MTMPIEVKEPDDSASYSVLIDDTIDEVHPDLLPIGNETISNRCSRISSLILTNCSISDILVFWIVFDSMARLDLFAFSIAIQILIHPALSAIVTLTTEMKLWSRKGQRRVLGKVISSYLTQDIPGRYYFILQYVVNNVTYQKKFPDNGFGLLRTEKFFEVVINDDDPKDAVLAVEVDHYNKHGVKAFYQLRFACNIINLLLPLLLLLLDCSPNLTTQLFGPARQDQCSKTKWIDALAHYFVILGLYPLQQFLDNYIQTKKGVETQAVALDTVTNPIVPPPQTYNDVFDQSILLTSPCTHHRLTFDLTLLICPLTHHRLTYDCAANLLFVVLIMYNMAKFDMPTAFCNIFISFFIALWAFWGASLITRHVFVKPVQAQFQEEGLPLKNMTVLKSDDSHVGPIFVSVYIIQYEVDVINSSGKPDIVKVQARIYGRDLDSLRVLPLQPRCICAPSSSKGYTGLICFILTTPFACISFYDWYERNNWYEKLSFALITITLCMLGALCIAIGDLDVLDALKGKSGDIVVVSDGNEYT